MSNDSARLVVQRGPIPNEEFPLTAERITVGRAPANDITLTDPEVSRRHAQIVLQAGGYAIEDLGSTNGTFVNGRRVVGLTPLHHGDIIELGEAISLIYFEAGQPPIDATMAGQPVAVTEEASSARIRSRTAPPPSKDQRTGWTTRQWLLGCGCGFLLFVFLCMALLFFLDAYQQGRLLYCGPLQPLFELLLGPFGFSPACL
ncbi:MAG: FHA domain-containing protein [Chloroflexi bacterium]|nr:MAG: FHA domain-containing protein [Chloroflexota bacterium]